MFVLKLQKLLLKITNYSKVTQLKQEQLNFHLKFVGVLDTLTVVSKQMAVMAHTFLCNLSEVPKWTLTKYMGL